MIHNLCASKIIDQKSHAITSRAYILYKIVLFFSTRKPGIKCTIEHTTTKRRRVVSNILQISYSVVIRNMTEYRFAQHTPVPFPRYLNMVLTLFFHPAGGIYAFHFSAPNIK